MTPLAVNMNLSEICVCGRHTDLCWLLIHCSEMYSHNHHGHGEETAPSLQQQVPIRRPWLILHSVRQVRTKPFNKSAFQLRE